MDKPHGYLHDSLRTCNGHVTRQQRIRPSTCRHAAQRVSPFILFSPVSPSPSPCLSQPLWYRRVRESFSSTSHLPPSLSLPQTVCYIILPVLLSYSSTRHTIGEDQGRSWKDVQIACLQPCFWSSITRNSAYEALWNPLLHCTSVWWICSGLGGSGIKTYLCMSGLGMTSQSHADRSFDVLLYMKMYLTLLILCLGLSWPIQVSDGEPSMGS